MKKIIFTLMICIFSVVGYAIEDYYLAGDVVDLKIFCVLDTACNVSTNCSMTVHYPNGTNMVQDQNMTNNIQFFNYTLYNDTIIEDDFVLGIYTAYTYCQSGDLYDYATWQFEINNYGRDESGNGLLMLILLQPAVALMIILIIIAYILPGDNNINFGPDGNRVLELNYGYYVKLGCWLGAYLCFWVITFLSWQISRILLSLEGLSNILRMMFIVETILIFPIILLIVILGFVKIMQDSLLSKEIQRGLPPR